MLKENSSLAGRSFFEGENVQEQPLAYTAVRAAPTVFPAEKFLTVSVKAIFVEIFFCRELTRRPRRGLGLAVPRDC